jgi:hypothetical protein
VTRHRVESRLELLSAIGARAREQSPDLERSVQTITSAMGKPIVEARPGS